MLGAGLSSLLHCKKEQMRNNIKDILYIISILTIVEHFQPFCPDSELQTTAQLQNELTRMKRKVHIVISTWS